MGRVKELWQERGYENHADTRHDYYAAQLGFAAAELSSGEIQDILRSMRTADPHTYKAILTAVLREAKDA